MAARRELSFDSLDAAVADARHLLVAGYARAGNWSLGQCCEHVAFYVRGPLDGYPPTPLPVRAAFWAMRNTVGAAMKRKLLQERKMAAGQPTMTASVPPAGVADAAGVADFERQVERLKASAGPLRPSPLYGVVTADELTRMTCIHAAHHFSFLSPPDATLPPPNHHGA